MRISDWNSDVCSSDLVFGPLAGVPLDGPNIVGAVSVILWALVLVVTLKYVLLILRADHHGEGGILALASLASRSTRNRKLRGALLLIGVCGATPFYGEIGRASRRERVWPYV